LAIDVHLYVMVGMNHPHIRVFMRKSGEFKEVESRRSGGFGIPAVHKKEGRK